MSRKSCSDQTRWLAIRAALWGALADPNPISFAGLTFQVDFYRVRRLECPPSNYRRDVSGRLVALRLRVVARRIHVRRHIKHAGYKYVGWHI